MRRRPYINVAMARDTETAVYIEVRMPAISVTAKPLTGPVPNANSATPASSAVTLASRMVPEARVVAGRDRCLRRQAGSQFLAYSFVDQHVGVDRHADGQRDAGQARQRQRRAEEGHHRDHHQQVEQHRDVGDQAEHAVIDQEEDQHEAERDTGSRCVRARRSRHRGWDRRRAPRRSPSARPARRRAAATRGLRRTSGFPGRWSGSSCRTRPGWWRH